MRRKLFCEYGPFAYWISTQKCRLQRHFKNFISSRKIARHKEMNPLPVLVAEYATILFRDSVLFDPLMEQNKLENVMLAFPKVSHVVIKPGETFSFWALVGKCTKRKGYKTARMLRYQKPTRDIGGGLCQITNLLHFLALHSMLTITERYEHDYVDLYPDFGTQIPFGTGTAILYNYRDLRFKNNTDLTYQIIFYIKDNHFHGELRSDRPQKNTYRIESSDCYFSREKDGVYRNGKAIRHLIDKNTGDIISSEEIASYHAKVIYDTSNLEIKSCIEE